MIVYKQLPISDNPTFHIQEYFIEAIKFIEKVTLEGYNILIHCLGGISRSVTITISYVMIKMKYSAEEGIIYVKKIHPIAMPNPGFVKQLKNFEKTLSIYFKLLDESFTKINKIDFELLETCGNDSMFRQLL